MAKRLNTDPATMVRIVRVLGFASFREFQKYLHDLSIAFATSADTMQTASSERGRYAYVADSIERDLKNLQGLKNSLDAGRLTELAKRMYASRRILVLAGDWPLTSPNIWSIRPACWVCRSSRPPRPAVSAT